MRERGRERERQKRERGERDKGYTCTCMYKFEFRTITVKQLYISQYFTHLVPTINKQLSSAVWSHDQLYMSHDHNYMYIPSLIGGYIQHYTCTHVIYYT